MKIKKHYVLAAALVLALGAAVYLNWQFSGTPLISPTSKELGAATYVNNDAKATADEAEMTAESEMTPEAKLAKARTDRTQAQDKAIEEAENILSLSDTSEDAKAEAVAAANQIEQRILAQSNIEGILSAKGYPGAMCYLSDSGCTVTVLSSQLTDEAPIIIKETVISQTEVEFNNIVIVDV
ncbi:MAG: SpoIIIAH-like family protein [Ruminococcus sp.]|nr:SpoIIIAH-like family protein [Ruminococcus sp.]